MKIFVSSFISVLIILGTSLFILSLFHDMKTPPPKRPEVYLIGCFSDGEIIFHGEAIGPTTTDDDGKIVFFSVELNAEVRLSNATCVEIHKNATETAYPKKQIDPPTEKSRMINEYVEIL